MRPRYYIMIVAFALLVFGQSNAFADKMPAPAKRAGHGLKHAKPHIKKAKHTSAKHKPAKHRRAKVTKQDSDLRINMPVPGSAGEERSYWFYQRRSWPNEEIDPAMYPDALEEARKMPKTLFGRSGKHSVASAMSWTSIGPTAIDGRVTAIATHPTDPNIFYIGAASGGLWRTSDHGTSWTCVTDTFGSLAVGCVAVDPVEPATLYLGQGECNGSADSYPGNGLWKSTDEGAHWQYLKFGSTQYISRIVVDPKDHMTLYVSILGSRSASDTSRGIYKSIDGGATWQHSLLARAGKYSSSTPVPFIDLAINPNNDSQLVAFAWQKAGTEGNCGQHTGLWRSSDAGATWARLDTLASSGLPNGMTEKVLGRGALYWSAGDGQTSYVYAAYTRADTNAITRYRFDENFKGLYRSSDAGVHWTKVLDSSARIPYGLQGLDSCDIMNKQGGYNLYLAGNPHHPNEVYLGGIDVLRSTDYGQSFTDITKSYSEYYITGNREQHSDQHGLAFTSATSGDDMLVVSDGGVFSSTNFGTSWKQLQGLPITMFYSIEPWGPGMAATGATVMPSELRVFGGTQDNGTVAKGLTDDPEFVWINHGDGGVAQAHPTDKEKLISSLQLGKIFARNSLDSLTTVTPIRDANGRHAAWHTITKSLLNGVITDSTEAASFIAPVVLDPERPNELYTGRLHVYKATIDWNDLDHVAWQSWSPTIAGDSSNPRRWYAGDIEAIALGVRDARGRPMLWAGGSMSKSPYSSVWRTVLDPDRPDSVPPRWIKINTGLPGSTISAIVPDRSDSLTAFISTLGSGVNDMHVWKTTDGGLHWTNISGNLPHAPLSQLLIDTLAEGGLAANKNKCVIVASDVGVYATTNGGTNWSQLGDGLPHVVVGDIKIYKNLLIAATHGRSAYAMDISGLQVGAAGVSVSSDEVSSAVYPNPVQRGGTITISGARESAVTFTSEVSAIETNVSGEEHAGNVTVTLPNTMATGAYFVHYIDNAGARRTARLVVLP